MHVHLETCWRRHARFLYRCRDVSGSGETNVTAHGSGARGFPMDRLAPPNRHPEHPNSRNCRTSFCLRGGFVESLGGNSQGSLSREGRQVQLCHAFEISPPGVAGGKSPIEVNGKFRSRGRKQDLRLMETSSEPNRRRRPRAQPTERKDVLDLGSRWIRFNHLPQLGHHKASRRRNVWRGGWLHSGGTCRRGAGRDDGDRGCNLKNVINNKWQASKY